MSEKYRVFFKYGAHYHTKSVEVVADFNEWEPGNLVLEDDDGDNIWWGEAKLPSGVYHFKYLVDGKEYHLDPNLPSESNGNGFQNSVLKVGKAKLTDNFFHSPDCIDFYSEHSFYMRAILNCEKYKGAKLIVVVDDFINTVNGYELFRDEVYIYMIFKLENGCTSAKNLLYYFEVDRADGGFDYFGKNGLVDSEWEVENFEYKKPEAASFTSPDWVKDAVFYQIFPERFYNGNPRLNPPDIKDPKTPPKPDTFYGGDLDGIIKKIDHIKELGANALYLNPIFEAPSTHKYDASDYTKIDPHFGDEAVFNKFVKKLKDKSMRFILDGVFNHTGNSFWAFEDIKNKGEKSAYKDWYFIKKFPLMADGKPNYDCWWNFPVHPKLNTDNPEVKKHLLDVTRMWLEKGADGWRLDVPCEIDHPFWKEFRKTVKSVDEDKYIVGEIWHNASQWLMGDEFDASMNYRFRDATVSFFAKRKINAEEFVKQIGQQLFDYPMQANFAMMNLLSSHDTARFFTIAENDPIRVMLALAFQFTYVGAPSIYYGEEIAMTGDKDPDNRKFMNWNKNEWNKQIYDAYKFLIKIRNENEVLRRGEIKFFFAKDMAIGFERFFNNEHLYILINNSEKNISIDITNYAGNGDFIDIFKNYPLKRKRAFTLYANDFVILRKTKERE